LPRLLATGRWIASFGKGETKTGENILVQRLRIRNRSEPHDTLDSDSWLLSFGRESGALPVVVVPPGVVAPTGGANSEEQDEGDNPSEKAGGHGKPSEGGNKVTRRIVHPAHHGLRRSTRFASAIGDSQQGRFDRLYAIDKNPVTRFSFPSSHLISTAERYGHARDKAAQRPDG
jgi:hypothetical protein